MFFTFAVYIAGDGEGFITQYSMLLVYYAHYAYRVSDTDIKIHFFSGFVYIRL
jgi:hypothetical protein